MVREKRYWQKSVSRRSALVRGVALGGAGVAAAVVLSCGQKERPAAPPAPMVKQPKRGGTLNRRALQGSGVFVGGLDPHLQNTSQTGLMGLFYQTLVRENPRTFQVEPEIAQRWEQPSQTEYIFTLAPGIRWHNKPPVNGRALTTGDVLFSLNRLRTDDPRFVPRSLLAAVAKIEAVDSSTVKVTTKRPDVASLRKLAGFSFKILAPEAVERFEGRFTTAESAIGTGAFIFQTKDDVSGTVIRNPDYWKPGLPYLDAVRMLDIRDEQAAWAAFLAKQIDVSYVPGTEAKKFVAEQGRNFQAEWFNDVGFTTIAANTGKKPFDDARVTRALRLLVDHQEALTAWAEVWWGRGYLSIAFPSALADWDLTPQEYGRFLEFKQPKDEAAREALTLLSAAGFTRDTPLRFELTSYSAPDWALGYIQLLQDQFRRLGQTVVQVTSVKNFDAPTLATVLAKGDFEYAIYNQSPSPPTEPDAWFQFYYRTNGALNYGKWSDPVLDQMVDQQLAIFEEPKRRAAVKEILGYLVQKCPYMGWSGRYTLNASQLKVQDWAPESNSAIWGYQYEHVWLDT